MSRYFSAVGYFRNQFGSRLQKVVVDAGFTCPNRDGTVAVGGCTYCNNDAFHPNYSTKEKTIISQIEEGIEFHSKRYRNAEKFLAYFQPYSNSYASLDTLKRRYEQALSHPKVCGIVIGTRPDCMDEHKLDYLKELSQDNVVILEYGVESCFDRTLERINRGHKFEVARQTIMATAERGLHQGAHFIFGLPGESVEDMLNYAEIINDLPIQSAKFHQLQIVKGTVMETEFAEKQADFVQFSLEEYLDFFVDFLERLRPDLCVERFAGEVPPRFVNSNPWGLIRNVELIRLLEARLEQRDTYQGAKLRKIPKNL